MSDAEVTHRPGGGSPRRRVKRATVAQIEALGKEGEQFGRFHVIERLGSGGMGVVIAAYDPELDRKVAIKVLRPDGVLARDELREQMVREAQAMARLSHPNVVAVYEVGTVERAFFLVMELVDGGTLKTWMETSHGRPWREVVKTLVAAGRGLAAAHAHGLVHRDFKPHNVLVGKDGRARVTDFGVVGVAGQTDALAVGTPAYMAPEQREPVIVDARADQFAFCATLYEALYGQVPFAGATSEERALAESAGLPPPPRSEAPAWIHAVLARGLSIDPAARFGTMDELLAALERDPRRRWRAAIAGGLVAALAVVAVMGWQRAASSRADDPCASSAPALEDTWNPATRAALASAFGTSRGELGAETAARVTKRLDDYAGSWSATRDAVCAAHADAVPASALACLDRRREHFVALTGVLAQRGDPDIVEHAVAAVASLEPPRECSSTGPVPGVLPAPATRGDRARLDLARSLLDAGSTMPAIAHARALLAVTDRPELEAGAALVLGTALAQLEDASGAREALLRALRAASAAGLDDLAARAYTELAWVTSYIDGKPTERLSMAPFVDAAVARAGAPAHLRAYAEYSMGSALTELGRYPEAKTHLDRAYEIWKHELDPSHPEAARVLLTLGNVTSYQGDLFGAERTYREVIRLREAALGAHHPSLAGVLSNLAGIVLDRGKAPEALGLCDRSLALSVGGVRIAALKCRGRALARLGQVDAAEAALTEAATAAASAPNGQSVYILTELGELAIDRGDPARAIELCDKALAGFSPGIEADHPDRSWPLACRGRAHLARAELTDARADLEAALALLGGGGEAVHRARTRFLLARTLRALDTDLPQQRELASLALAVYRDVGDVARADEVSGWGAGPSR